MNYKKMLMLLLILQIVAIKSTEDWITKREWPYLTSQALKTRYALTAYLLNDVDTIIEIGGYKTPIDGFVKDKNVVVIDPKIEAKNEGKVTYLPIKLQDWKDEVKSTNYAVVILGMDLHLDDNGWNKLIELIKNSKKTVLEFSSSYTPAHEQFKKICASTNKKSNLIIKMDLSENDASQYPEFYPYRNIHCLE
ncbi:MAG: hypothetical protein P4L22_01950 [Candidatus Babeliales bacterium]|nr:hypothetical protein [Candidatus Babeliales bacterium]